MYKIIIYSIICSNKAKQRRLYQHCMDEMLRKSQVQELSSSFYFLCVCVFWLVLMFHDSCNDNNDIVVLIKIAF